MRNILIDLNNLDSTIYDTAIIIEGEHNASQVVITLSPELTGHTNSLIFRLNQNAPYIVNTVVPVNGIITYPITNVITTEPGTLRVEIQSYDANTMLTKSVVIPLKVSKGIGGTPITLPPTLWGTSADVQPTPSTYVLRDTLGAGKFDSVDYDLTPLTLPTAIPTGKMQWDSTYNLMDLGLQGITVGASLQIGQDLVCWCKNTSGVALPIGTVVAVTGSIGQVPSITQAKANGTTAQTKAFGVVAGFQIENNMSGYVSLAGFVTGVNTSTFNEGDIIYLSNIAGQITNIPPTPPSTVVNLGYVVKKAGAGAGRIYVKVDRESTAGIVLIEDAGNNYTSTTVEGALLEIANRLKAHGI